jgi:hypothetical protein
MHEVALVPSFSVLVTESTVSDLPSDLWFGELYVETYLRQS